MTSNRVGFAVIYRWRIIPGREEEFSRLWLHISELLKGRGSFGARLHMGADGIWYSYAQWPDSATRAKAFGLPHVDAQAGRALWACVAEEFPEILLEPVADCIVPDR